MNQLNTKKPSVRRATQRNNRSGITGVRPSLRKSETDGAAPHLQIQASWSLPRSGKRQPRYACTTFSVEANGLLRAVELAIQAREAGSGEPVGLTPRQAWNRMRHLVGGQAS